MMRGPEVGAGGRVPGHASPACRRSVQEEDHCFEALFRENGCYILGFIYQRVGDRETAAELTQEVFLKAYMALDRYRPLRPIRAWLTEIARNHVYDHFRKKKIATVQINEGIDIPEPDFYSDIEQQDLAERALRRLPDACRIPLTMRFYGGLTYEDISDALGIPASTLRVRIHRAKDRMRDILASLN